MGKRIKQTVREATLDYLVSLFLKNRDTVAISLKNNHRSDSFHSDQVGTKLGAKLTKAGKKQKKWVFATKLAYGNYVTEY